MGAPDWVDVFPIKHGDIPASYVIVYQRVVEFCLKLRSEYFDSLSIIDTHPKFTTLQQKLVGGWTNPFEKYATSSQKGKSSPNRGEIPKMFETTT